jgi:ATP-dependent exoDNAse (exonuclease V) alpha subunit
MMLEACEALASTSGKKVFTFAPSSEAVEVLRKEGAHGQSPSLALAETVQMLLLSEQKQKEVEGQILWIDEAGLLSAKDFRKLAEFAEKTHSRIILSGDVAQHRAVERGDLLRLLEKETPLRTAHLSQIRRQQISEYRSAVESLSQGEAATGFDKLDALGAIREIEDRAERSHTLAETYLAKVEAGKTALIVAPTHAEGREITAQVRELLRTKGLITGAEQKFIHLKNLGWTEAQKKDGNNFSPGQVLEFHQNVKGFKRGQKWEVKTVDANGRIFVGLEGRVQELPVKEAQRFSVYERQKLDVAVGDTVRITQNVMSVDGKLHLKNNSIYKVDSFEGMNLKLLPIAGLGKPAVLDISAGAHLTHGVVITSHASQGKTVDHVLISQPTATFSVASREQFYVSASRARQSVEIFTDSKALLREAIQKTEARQTAHELLWEEVPELQGVNPKQEKKEGINQKETERNKHLVLKVPPKQTKNKDRGMSI